MRLSHSIYSNEFFDQKEERPDLIVMRLAPASTALNKARALNPNATLNVVEKEGSSTYTVDSLAAHLLYSEASIYERAGRQIETQAMPEEFLNLGAGASSAMKEFNRERERLTKKYFPAALVAAEKAVLYQPKSRDYLRMLAVS